MTDAQPMFAHPIRFHHATPILRVRDLELSLTHYAEKLGFEMGFHIPGQFASISRGECTMYLSQGDQGHPGGWVWIGVGDAAALHDELCARGATIRQPPTNYAWAYEMQITDPDGNVLRFGSDPKEGEPFGDWIDMNGVRWGRDGDGNITRQD